MERAAQLKRFVEHFRAGEKAPEEQAIGIELEYLVLDGESLAAVPYSGQQGIADLLGCLVAKGWSPVWEEGHLIGAEKDGVSIALEPGAQLEVNFAPEESIGQIEDIYRRVLAEIVEILEERGQILVALGYQPVTPIEQISLLPRQRYRWMYTYLGTRGQSAHRMMKGTAATQVCVDYTDEEDFRIKSRVISFLTPFMYAVFDNAPLYEGEVNHPVALRYRIWSDCDDDRCGYPKGIFTEDYSYEKYAAYILDSPALIVLKDGQLSYAGGEKPVKEYFDPETFTDDELDYLLSMCFPDVRVRRYLEIRMADSLPYPLNFGYVALWKGLLYDQFNLQRLYTEAREFGETALVGLRERVLRDGTQAAAGAFTVLERFQNYLELAKGALSASELHYLAPIEEMVSQGLTPRELTLSRLSQGTRTAIQWCVLSPETLNLNLRGRV